MAADVDAARQERRRTQERLRQRERRRRLREEAEAKASAAPKRRRRSEVSDSDDDDDDEDHDQDDDEATPRPLGLGRVHRDVVTYAGFTHHGHRFLVGDFVHMCAPDTSTPPYVALLEHVFAQRSDADRSSLWCEVRWFYRPEDTSAGRQPDDGAVGESGHVAPGLATCGRRRTLRRGGRAGRVGAAAERWQHELFESMHRDVNPAEAVEDHCAVLTMLEYGRYIKEVRRRELAGLQAAVTAPGQHGGPLPMDRVYFCRRGYNPGRSRFYPLDPDQSLFAKVPPPV